VLRKFEVLTVIVFLGLSIFSFGDQVTLKNGDRLTGTVIKSDGKTLVLDTDAAGKITLKFDAIQDIRSDAELHVTVKGGKTVVGPVTTTDGKLQIATKSSGTVETPKEQVTLIRNDAEQQAYEESLHPGLWHGWNGGINVGFAVARGNSQTENLALAFNALHPTLDDKITLYASSINAKNDLATPSTVANLSQGGFRYDRDLDSWKLFVFGAADFMANALQFLDLRQVYSGGLGYHVIKSDRTILDFFGGLNYTHETYSNGALVPGTTNIFESYGHTNRFVAVTLGQELNQKVGSATVITESAGFFPNLQQTGEYPLYLQFGDRDQAEQASGLAESI